MMKRYLLILFIGITFFGQNAKSQNYEIKVKINGVKDSVIYLGHHYGDRKLVIDTTHIDGKGNAVFKGNRKLDKGIYLIAMPTRNMTYFEILISDNQKFSVETDTANYVKHMKVKSCNENKVFNEYQLYLGELHEQRTALNQEMEKYANDEQKMTELREKANQINNNRLEYVNNLINKYPDFFFTKILLAMKDIDIPQPPRDENGEITDHEFQYRYFKKHYFDYLDFSERGLLRTPILEGKINYFIEKMVVPLPDSLMHEAEMIINRAYEGGDSLVFRYVTSHLLRYFETSKIMGYDAVFVDIAEKWYLNGKAYWANDEFMEKLRERVMRISPNMIGNVSPNLLRMQTFDNSFISLHQVKADYTVLVFWEPDCGHCRKVLPALFQEYQDTLKTLNVNVFALYTQYDREEWTKFIESKELVDEGWYNVWDGPMPHSNFRNLYDIYSTPVVYLLGKDKRIVAKRINVEDLKKVIEFDKKRQAEGK